MLWTNAKRRTLVCGLTLLYWVCTPVRWFLDAESATHTNYVLVSLLILIGYTLFVGWLSYAFYRYVKHGPTTAGANGESRVQLATHTSLTDMLGARVMHSLNLVSVLFIFIAFLCAIPLGVLCFVVRVMLWLFSDALVLSAMGWKHVWYRDTYVQRFCAEDSRFVPHLDGIDLL